MLGKSAWHVESEKVEGGEIKAKVLAHAQSFMIISFRPPNANKKTRM